MLAKSWSPRCMGLINLEVVAQVRPSKNSRPQLFWSMPESSWIAPSRQPWVCLLLPINSPSPSRPINSNSQRLFFSKRPNSKANNTYQSWQWFQASSTTDRETSSSTLSLLSIHSRTSLSLLLPSSLVRIQLSLTLALTGKRPQRPMSSKLISRGLKKRKWKSRLKMTGCFKLAGRGTWRRKTRMIHGIVLNVAVASSWEGSSCLKMPR